MKNEKCTLRDVEYGEPVCLGDSGAVRADPRAKARNAVRAMGPGGVRYVLKHDLEPGGGALPEFGRWPLPVRVIAGLVAAKLLQEADAARRVPADQGKPVKGLHPAVVHLVPEVPLHHGLVLPVEKLEDIPLKDGPPGVPFVEPELDILSAVVLRAPAFDVRKAWLRRENPWWTPLTEIFYISVL